MRRLSHRISLVVGMALLLAASGCAAQEAQDDTPSATQQRLRVSGSGTCLPLLRILTDAYSAQNEDVEFVYLPGLHSGGGIRGVASGDLELGAVSRSLSDEESDLDLRYVQLSDDGLAIATHPSVALEGLTSDDVCEIYEGKHEDWSEFGGNDMPITILDRNEDESAKIILRKYVLGGDLAVTPKAVNLFYEPDMIEGLEQTPGAIGYFSLGFGLSEEIPVNYLELDGVPPTIESIEAREYTMVRPLGVVVAEPVDPVAEEFLAWAQSQEARDLMRERGFAPVLSEGE